MQQPTQRTNRSKRLHVVYFVDAARTKSLSMSVRGFVVACVASGAAFVAAAGALVLYVKRESQARADASYIQELKAGLIAQSVAFERILSDSSSEEGKIELSKRSRAIEHEILANLASPVRKGGPNQEPLQLGKVTDSLSSLDTATMNLVAMGGAGLEQGARDEKATDPRNETNGGTDRTDGPGAPGGTAGTNGKPGESLSTRARGTEHAPDAGKQPETAARTQGNKETAATRGGNVSLAAKVPSAVYPGTTTGPVSFERLRIRDGATVHADAEEETDEDGNTGATNLEGMGSVVSFTIANHDPARSLVGRVCALAVLTQGTVVTQPPGLRLSAGTLDPSEGCKGGQLVRFARLRPTDLRFNAPPGKIKEVRVFFWEGPGKPIHADSLRPNPQPK